MIEELGYHVAVKAGTIEEAKPLAKEADFEFAALGETNFSYWTSLRLIPEEVSRSQ
jgi:hypothetical protein